MIVRRLLGRAEEMKRSLGGAETSVRNCYVFAIITILLDCGV